MHGNSVYPLSKNLFRQWIFLFLPILEKGNTGKSEALKKKKDLHISRTSLGVQLNFYEDTAAALEVFSGSNFFAQFFSADASFGAPLNSQIRY